MFQNVLIGVDGRPGGRDAIALARRLAAPSAHFTLVNVYGAGPGLMPGHRASLYLASECRLAIDRLEREREATGMHAELQPCADPSVGRGLKGRATTFEADLLVVGHTRHDGFERYALGDDTNAALTGAPCAVAIAPEGFADSMPDAGAGAFRRIGVGYDHRPDSRHALEVARRIATDAGGTVHVMSVVVPRRVRYGHTPPEGWFEEPERRIVAERDRLAHLGTAGADADAAYGDPGEVLAGFSGSVDLLIVGSRGHGPVARVLHGSTSHYLARHAACPVLVLPRVDAPVATASDSQVSIAVGI